MDSKIEEAESYTTHKQLLPSTEESSPCTDTATPEQQKNVSSSCMTELEGDLFDAPESSILIHACNCKGSWGAGIAKVFRLKYPHAYEVYRKQCEMFINSPESRIVIDPTSGKEVKLSRPEGEVLLIPPQPGDYEREKKGSKAASRKKGGSFCPHWIACLFTSSGYGKGKSPELAVLRNTRLSVEELRSKVETVSRKKVDTDKDEKLEEMGGLYGCRFNAGLFGVEWERTKQVLENVGLIMTIVTPPV